MGRLSAILAASALTACGTAAAEQTAYELRVHVDSDPGEGLAEVGIFRDQRQVGTTDIRGLSTLRLRGREGERVALRARCPETHLTPDAPSTVILRSYVGREAPELSIRCPPRQRTLAVVVLAKNGANLPLTHRGAEIGRTDAQGVAHLTLASEPGDAFEVTLDTSSQPTLRPPNPGARFVIGAQDEALLFDPALTVAPPKRKKRHRAPKPDLPQRIR
jgi:hypothetical protein